MLSCAIIGDECVKLMDDRVCRGHIHSVFDRVVNVETDAAHGIDCLFSVCVRDVPPAPARIIVDSESSWLHQGLEPGQEFSVTCTNAPIWHGMDKYTLAAPEVILQRISKIYVPASDTLRDIAYNDVDVLIGRGLGLTPSGDDFLAGVLYSLHFLKEYSLLEPLSQKVKNLLDTTTRLSRHFLKYALAGKWGQTEQDVMSALMTDAGGDLNGAVDNLLAVGSSSGADELAGIMAGIDAALERRMK